MNRKILIVEDEPRTAEWMEVYLKRAGYETFTARNGREGLNMAGSCNPELILLDILLPQLNGMELCRILRRDNEVPIIMVTSRGAREDLIKGLNCGADDYIVKPFDPDELVARIAALLRRTTSPAKTSITCGPFLIDEEARKISLEGADIPLSSAQFALMKVFLTNPGRVFSREQLIDAAFGGSFDTYERSIDAHIKRLRKLVHREGFSPIETVYGAGYRFTCS